MTTNSNHTWSLFTRWGQWLGNVASKEEAKASAWSCALNRGEPVDIYLDGSSKRVWTEMPESSERKTDAITVWAARGATPYDTWIQRVGAEAPCLADGLQRDETDALRATSGAETCVWPDHWPLEQDADVEAWRAANRQDYALWSLRAAKLTAGWDKKSTNS